MWRNRHTRSVQGAVGATPWRFKSSHAHSFISVNVLLCELCLVNISLS